MIGDGWFKTKELVAKVSTGDYLKTNSLVGLCDGQNPIQRTHRR